MTDILEFKGSTRWCSNFVGPEVKYGNIWFPRVENAYQAAKTLDMKIRVNLAQPDVSAAEAKAIGNDLAIRPDWTVQRRLLTMEILVRQKFLNKDYLEKLLATGDCYIQEGNYWHDNFWGNCLCKKCKDITGMNRLGFLLIELRKELKPFSVIFKQKEAFSCLETTMPVI